MRIRYSPPVFLSVAAIAVLSGSVAAQSYTGTFVMSNTEGKLVTVTLNQDAGGNITGTMAGSGVTFQIEGIVDEGIAAGAMFSDEGGVYFEAQLQGDELLLSLFDVGPDGEPNYAQSRDLVMRRSTGAAAVAGPAGGGANPLARANPLAVGSPFVGEFVGEAIALTLQGEAGSYTGTLTFQGNSYPVTATEAGGRITGSFSAGGTDYSFEASVQGKDMTLVSEGASYRLTRQGPGAAPTNPLRAGAAPGGASGGAAASGEGGLIGSWSCQTGEGMARLEFLSPTELAWNGERSEYTLTAGVVRVREDWGPVDYRYQLSGDNLTVSAPDGSTLQCSRTAAARRTLSGAEAPGTGLERLVRGEKCGYTASPDGGFSTTRRLFFDGQGRFVYTTLSEVDVPEVIGYGQAAGDPGSYRVMGSNRGDEVHLLFDNGDRIVMYVHHLYQGEIMELWYNDIVYAPGLCPGAEPRN